jgi:hypothetical protein
MTLFLEQKQTVYVRRHGTQHNDTQHNDPQHNDTQHNDTQHNDTQQNDTQRAYLRPSTGLFATLDINSIQRHSIVCHFIGHQDTA